MVLLYSGTYGHKLTADVLGSVPKQLIVSDAAEPCRVHVLAHGMS